MSGEHKLLKDNVLPTHERLTVLIGHTRDYIIQLEARAEAAEKERDELRFWLTGWKELHALAMNEVLPRGKNRAYQETDK